MDPYGSQPPQRREQQPAPSGTPIYDRLVAEWRASGHDPQPEAPRQPAAPRTGFVPAARSSDEAAGT
ncbi:MULTISPECIES: hypothetical protein [unclassified Streptomyces]|uniref:hypothetical protein n=1 Tax=unclassified Streptomyces TaxID=2593676 RepID=UPI000CD5080D|nr:MULTISPECIES: hypothetical protein [unclassified Streptomyces]MCI4046206.1 hypothetical protein [Streptomyces sp. TRM75563]